jgi:CrcB protein
LFVLNAFFLVGVGGFLGALFRHYVNTALPYPTLLVNAAGGLLIGAATILVRSHPLQLLFITGFLGALTTFSAFTLESLQLYRESGAFSMFTNILLNITTAFAAFLIGEYIAKFFST